MPLVDFGPQPQHVIKLDPLALKPFAALCFRESRDKLRDLGNTGSCTSQDIEDRHCIVDDDARLRQIMVGELADRRVRTFRFPCARFYPHFLRWKNAFKLHRVLI